MLVLQINFIIEMPYIYYKAVKPQNIPIQNKISNYEYKGVHSSTATGRWNNKLFPGGDEKFCILYKQIDKKDDKCSRQDIDFVPENSLLTESGDIRSGERVYTDELPATKETIKAHSKVSVNPSLNLLPKNDSNYSQTSIQNNTTVRNLLSNVGCSHTCENSVDTKTFLPKSSDEIYNDDEVIKEIQINDISMIKHVNISKQNKEKWETIILIHMAILEELKINEKENKKIYKGFIEDLKNVYVEYAHLRNKDYVTEKNTEDLGDNLNYEELYNYKKKIFMTKLLIQIFMMNIEEDKNEQFLQKKQLFLEIIIDEINSSNNSVENSEIMKISEETNNDL
ncbi:STP1 protein [Plasmodium brasilianum]|uniref:STP1 protein n=1 Tax=Plasmodium brasilianum TaxID=5824 RepID=A0ACB9Y2T7_PLABR|nr:STP1 protein [Plasmodium brasilianum]